MEAKALIERAASIIKVCRLVNTPGMDEVAIKLNMVPTANEIEEAALWHKTFELAQSVPVKRAFDIAMELRRGI